MSTFNETDASLNRVLAEGRLVDSLVDVIYRAASHAAEGRSW